MSSSQARLADLDRPPASGNRGGGDLDITTVTRLEDFAALRDEWTALFERAAAPQQVFQSFVFLDHWARHYLDGHTALSIVTGRENDRLVMAWPLVRRRKAGVNILSFMGAPVAQFSDLLIEDGANAETWLRAGWSAIQKLGADVLEARKVRADSIFVRCPLDGGTIVTERAEAPFADLTRRIGPNGPGEVYSAKERSNHRRHVRRLAERGAVAFHHHLPGAKAAELAAQAVALKRAWLDRNSILSPTVADPRFEAFFRDIARDGGDASPLRISVVECGGRPVGIDLSFDCKGRSFGHVLASDPSFEREGVGGILVQQVFANARQRGNTVFDLLAPADSYKLQHADGSTSVQDILVPFTAKGRLFSELVLRRLVPLMKKAARLLPSRLFQSLASHLRS